MIYLVTNRHIVNGDFYTKIKEACISGVDCIILREKDLDYDKYLDLAIKVKSITDKYNIPLIINGNIDVANNIDSYGYHCSFKSIIKETKAYKYQGVSVHSLKEAILAEEYGADYLLVGHIFKTECKKGLDPRGVNFIKEIIENVSIPVIAIGGINKNTVSKLYSNNIFNIAIMSGIMSSSNTAKSISELKGDCFV